MFYQGSNPPNSVESSVLCQRIPNSVPNTDGGHGLSLQPFEGGAGNQNTSQDTEGDS